MIDFFSQLIPTVLICIFLSSMVRSTFGFGDALVAMPLLALVVDLDMARALVALVSITTAAGILQQDVRSVNRAVAWRMILSSAVGIPIGMFLLEGFAPWLVKAVLGILVGGFGLYSITRLDLPRLESDRWSVLFGLAAGVLGGAYNTVGLPLVIYGAARRWGAAEFRATIQSVFLPTSVLIVVGHALQRRIDAVVLSHYAASLPLIAASLAVGYWLNRRLSAARFLNFVYAALIVVGAVLVMQAVRGGTS